MKLLEKEKNAANVRALAPARGASKPPVAIRVRVVQPARRKDKAIDEICARIVAFAVVMGVVYVASTMMGYVALERARQSVRQGMGRAGDARAQAKAARASIEAATNPSELRAWADAHGFVASQGNDPAAPGGAGSGRVARR